MKQRKFHEARWQEPIIMEMGSPGERGILLPEMDEEIVEQSEEISELLPNTLKREDEPKLPELSQPQLYRHYLRLSQETMGAAFDIDIGLGTCTMKYNPVIHEKFAGSPQIRDLHPCQPESTVQGILEIMYLTETYLKEISGMDAFCLFPGGGSQAIFSNVLVMRAYHQKVHPGEQRDEVITTILSHPGNPGAASTAGYKVITLMPGKDGLPDLEALKAAVSPRTAGLMITNPEDTGLYNPNIREIVDAVHSVGGLCIYDQANLNGLFGITRAREAGFDMCHYNLHKSFSSPHGCQGPACGAQGVVSKLEPFLPSPAIRFHGEKYCFDYNRPDSIGKLRKFFGNPSVVLRAYAYIRTLGAEGLKDVAELSILNNNYLLSRLSDVKGLSLPWAEGVRRVDQSRLSWEKLTADTGVTTEDIDRRVVDYGLQSYFSSHHPRIIPEPFTPEPCETYSKADIDEFADIFHMISEEAYSNPELVKTAPHHAALSSQIREEYLHNPHLLATTWRAYQRHEKENAAATHTSHL